jgi:hypothetical protein
MATEADLLRLLNSAPVVNGDVVETLDDARLRSLRDDLHAVIRGQAAAAHLDPYLDGVSHLPSFGDGRLTWTLAGPPAAMPSAELVLEWARVEEELPGRLRACGNDECNKFLIDHSKPNTARWCSMAECGNRMKARRHHARQTGRVQPPR